MERVKSQFDPFAPRLIRILRVSAVILCRPAFLAATAACLLILTTMVWRSFYTCDATWPIFRGCQRNHGGSLKFTPTPRKQAWWRNRGRSSRAPGVSPPADAVAAAAFGQRSGSQTKHESAQEQLLAGRASGVSGGAREDGELDDGTMGIPDLEAGEEKAGEAHSFISAR